MKNITYKKSIQILKSNVVLGILGAFLLSSCGATMGGYSETDGVYYDPNTDTIPQGVMVNTGNRVGDYYDYQAVDNQNIYLNAENRNERWQDAQGSDWGTFTGTDTYYTDNWVTPFGYNSFYGFGMSFGFGSPWGYSGYYSPWGFGYSPFGGYYNPYYSYYNPYFGYNPYGYYSSPYGYYSPYYYQGYYGNGYNSYNAPRFNYKRSGTDGNTFRNGNTAVRPGNIQNSGFRNDTRIYNPQQNGNYRNSTQPNYNNQQRNDTQQRYRNTPQRATPPQQTYPDRDYRRNDTPVRNQSMDRGFRSGSSGSSTSSSGSTRSSGGFRR